MNEREQLIKNIADSSEIMQLIDRQEDICINTQKEIDKKKKECRIRILVLLFFLFICMSDVFAKILPMVFAMVITFGMPIGIWIYLKSRVKVCQDRLKNEQNNLLKSKLNEILQWLPMDYRDSFSYKSIAQYVDNMRANTLQEAINLLETEQHQERMERYAALADARYVAAKN